MYSILEQAKRRSTQRAAQSRDRRWLKSSAPAWQRDQKGVARIAESELGALSRSLAMLKPEQLIPILVFAVYILSREVKLSTGLLHAAYPEALRHTFGPLPPNYREILRRLLN